MKMEMKKIIKEIEIKYNLDSLISELFCDYYDFMDEKELIKGGCHFLSALLHIILSEFQIDNILCLGNVRLDDKVFSHSWIEIDEKIYDIAISNTNDMNCFTKGVVFYGFETDTMLSDRVKYGILTNDDLVDVTGRTVCQMNLGEYISKCPKGKNYVLKLILDFSKTHKKYLNSSRLYEKYKNEKWTRR